MAGLCLLYALYGVVSYWRSYLAGLVGHRVIFDLRQALYLHVQRLSLSFFDRERIGGIVSRITGDIASAQNFVGAAFVNTAMDLSCLVAIVAILFFVHAQLALVSLSILPFYALLSFHPQKRTRERSPQIHRQMQEISRFPLCCTNSLPALQPSKHSRKRSQCLVSSRGKANGISAASSTMYY